MAVTFKPVEDKDFDQIVVLYHTIQTFTADGIIEEVKTFTFTTDG